MPQFPGNRLVRHLLAGASAAIAIATAVPYAHAQSSPVTASGDVLVTNAQTSSQLTFANGDALRAPVIATGPTDAATIAIDGNALAVTARANSASLLLAPDASVTPAPIPTTLRADGETVSGTANLLIANRQELRGGGSAQADQFGAPFRIVIGPVSGSTITIDDDRSDVLSRGNAVVSAIDVPTVSGGGGAGIVSSQVARANDLPADDFTGVAARVRGGSLLESGALTAIGISLSGNVGSADAASNAADNSLTAPIESAETPLPGPVMLSVPVGDAGATSARFAILSRQSASNVVKARSGFRNDVMLDDGPTVRSAIDGNMDASTIVSNGNSSDASAKGNLAANRLTLTGNGAGGTGAIGAIANIQALTGARIVGSTNAGVGVGIAGALTNSSISASENVFTVSAAGNVTTDNRLTISGDVAADAGSSSASALSAQSMATFTVDTWQDYGTTGISASLAGPAVRIAVAGDIGATTIEGTGNTEIARAFGDSASNTMAIEATRFGGSAALASRQAGQGKIIATLGDANDPGGVTLWAGGPTRGSRLTVTDNSMLGAATGNVAVNAFDLTGADLVGGTSGAAGPWGDDYGATGTLALLNDQTIGDPAVAGGTPAITSSVTTRSGLMSSGPLVDSLVTIAGNDQRSAATGNRASNRLTSATATVDGASLALSSTQFGQAAVAATSDMTIAAPGRLDDSVLSMLNNATVATASVNDVENKVVLTAAKGSGGTLSSVSAGPLGAASATGMVALANQQFATGSATATSVSSFGAPPLSAIDASRLILEGNDVVADSNGNRALNAVSASLASGDGGAALANAQTNMARIDASATMNGLGFGSPAITGSSLSSSANGIAATARGNAADNAVTLDATAAPGASARDGRDWSQATGNAVLANAQDNYGSVSANAGGLVALNPGPVTGSSLLIANNAMSASAYGNIASNAITMSAATNYGGVALNNVQANYGPVTATVTGAGYQSLTGSLTASAIGITGNRISASATGNQASSAIATPR